ncbi:MAG: glycosyltransferase [Solirubrobacteraceae bacterium]
MPADSDDALHVKLESHLPARLPAGCATAIFLYGHCFHRTMAVRRLELLLDGVRSFPDAKSMPRRDLFQWLRSTGVDPEGRSYRSGFWSVLEVRAGEGPRVVRLEARVALENGAQRVVPLGCIEVQAARLERDVRQRFPVPSAQHVARPAAGTIAVCIASFEPDPELFAIQIESLRAQTDRRWICVISDDGSSQHTLERMADAIADDSRFSLTRNDRRLGPYLNFERALALAPGDAAAIAPCDQDDRWYPDKLAVLRSALGTAQMVFSDQRLVDRDGRVLRDSLWYGRRNDHSNLASLLVANAIPGASMLFDARLAKLVLPFPQAPGVPYHDHWLALVALAAGEIAYVDRPLYDYVQHAAAVSGDLLTEAAPPGPTARTGRVGGPDRGFRAALSGSRGLRSAYFGGYMTRAVLARALLMRCASLLTPGKRRALRWFIASERSPAAFAWLAARPLRRLAGRDETLGGEAGLAKGIVWRWLLSLVVAGAHHPGRRAYDASFPDPPVFEQPRLRRWRALS